jgi:hypothetical protein
MATANKLDSQLFEIIKKLDISNKGKVLNFVNSLLTPKEKHSKLMKLAGSVSEVDADLMEKAIEEGCENIDLDGWK